MLLPPLELGNPYSGCYLSWVQKKGISLVIVPYTNKMVIHFAKDFTLRALKYKPKNARERDRDASASISTRRAMLVLSLRNARKPPNAKVP